MWKHDDFATLVQDLAAVVSKNKSFAQRIVNQFLDHDHDVKQFTWMDIRVVLLNLGIEWTDSESELVYAHPQQVFGLTPVWPATAVTQQAAQQENVVALLEHQPEQCVVASLLLHYYYIMSNIDP